jgi:Glutaminase
MDKQKNDFDIITEAYETYKGNTDGANANYIPYLANVPKNLFGITICMANGEMVSIGDTKYKFGIESVSKVHTAILYLRQHGADNLFKEYWSRCNRFTI